MRVAIFADMEGISGISGSSFVTKGAPEYLLGQRYLTDDINACARGLKEAGVDEVLVYDGHSSGCNVLWHELEPNVILVQGCGAQERFPELESCCGLTLLGYHARAGTEGALLEHTYSSKSIQNCWLNGQLVGEFGIDAAIAGEHGVPVIMTSGDDKLCAEALEWIPSVKTCEVKKALACQQASLLPRQEAHRRLFECARDAFGNIGSVKPLVLEKPVTVRKEFVERIQLPRKLANPDLRFIDGRTVEAAAETVEEAFWKI